MVTLVAGTFCWPLLLATNHFATESKINTIRHLLLATWLMSTMVWQAPSFGWHRLFCFRLQRILSTFRNKWQSWEDQVWGPDFQFSISNWENQVLGPDFQFSILNFKLRRPRPAKGTFSAATLASVGPECRVMGEGNLGTNVNTKY